MGYNLPQLKLKLHVTKGVYQWYTKKLLSNHYKAYEEFRFSGIYVPPSSLYLTVKTAGLQLLSLGSYSTNNRLHSILKWTVVTE